MGRSHHEYARVGPLGGRDGFGEDWPITHADLAPYYETVEKYIGISGKEEGLPQRLQVLAHGLSTHAQRIKAYRLATKIAHASGKASSAEQRILDLLQATFGLADDEVSRLDRGAGA